MHSEHREQGLLIPSLRFFITTANKDETGKRLRSGKWLGSCPHYEKPSAEHQLNPFTLQAFGTAPVAKGVVGYLCGTPEPGWVLQSCAGVGLGWIRTRFKARDERVGAGLLSGSNFASD